MIQETGRSYSLKTQDKSIIGCIFRNGANFTDIKRTINFKQRSTTTTTTEGSLYSDVPNVINISKHIETETSKFNRITKREKKYVFDSNNKIGHFEFSERSSIFFKEKDITRRVRILFENFRDYPNNLPYCKFIDIYMPEIKKQICAEIRYSYDKDNNLVAKETTIFKDLPFPSKKGYDSLIPKKIITRSYLPPTQSSSSPH